MSMDRYERENLGAAVLLVLLAAFLLWRGFVR